MPKRTRRDTPISSHTHPAEESGPSASPPAVLTRAENASLVSSGRPQYPAATDGDDSQISPTSPEVTSHPVSGSTIFNCNRQEKCNSGQNLATAVCDNLFLKVPALKMYVVGVECLGKNNSSRARLDASSHNKDRSPKFPSPLKS